MDETVQFLIQHGYALLFTGRTSAQVALLLKRKGNTKVRPLAGGIDAWFTNEFPVQAPDAVQEPSFGLPIAS